MNEERGMRDRGRGTDNFRLESLDCDASRDTAPVSAARPEQKDATRLAPALPPVSHPPSPTPLFVVDGVRKSFRDPAGGVLEVLRGVTFAARAGETLALVGASGAGKSTLLHVLGGLERADVGGVARLGEFDILRASGAELAAWRGREVGFVFQFHHLLADLSAEENVALPLLVARRGRIESRRIAVEMLDAVRLSDRVAHRAGELSGGEQQRVALARALVTSPRLVLADEPTGNLDARTGAEVCALLFRLCRAAHACVVVATHNEQLARACDRRLILEDGRVRESEV